MLISNFNKFLNIEDFKEYLFLFFVFFIGMVLMYIGYFQTIDDNNGFFFTSFLSICLLIYIIYFGIFSKPFYSLYAWFVFLLFFPKKAINSDYNNSIFSSLFLTGNENLSFSLYEILELGIVLTILIVLVKNNLFKKIDFIEALIFLMISIGLYNIFFINQYSNYILSYQSLMPLLNAFVIYKSIHLIKDRKQLEKILNLFILFSTILFIEYLIGRLNILPDSIYYYIFNYRNAFRSILVSSDLLLGLLLIVSAFISVYKYKMTKNRSFLILFIISNYLLLETFNRTPFFALVIVSVLVCLYYKEWKKLLIYLGVIYFLLIPMSKYFSKTQLPQYMVYSIKNNISVEEAYYKLYGDKKIGDIKDLFYANKKYDDMPERTDINHNFDRVGGYFDNSSLLDRFGASLRGIDVLIYTNFLGSGPGSAIDFMSNEKIPSYINENLFFNKKVKEFYLSIKDGSHPTNTHMLYTNLLVEYGIVCVFLYLLVLYKVFKLMGKKLFKNEENLAVISFAIIITYGMYYSLQAVPVLLSIMLFFLQLIDYKQIKETK